MARRFTKPKSELPFLHPQAFEDEAALILAEYGNAHKQITAPPVPIDDIVEEHFKMVVEFKDMRAEYPEGDVLGAIFFNDMKIVVDMRLVPEDYPAMRARYRFTLAHELSHWRLHRHLYLRRAHQPELMPSGQPKPDHVLRDGHNDPKEYQANRLASCLLMPCEMVKRAWHQMQGSMAPVYLDDLRAMQEQILAAQTTRRSGTGMRQDIIDNVLFEHAARPLAQTFEVSPEAMRYRLEGMKLLLRKKEPSLFE
jgi:Zn-dependent peptidase ImmA (M78 family)